MVRSLKKERTRGHQDAANRGSTREASENNDTNLKLAEGRRPTKIEERHF
ncbi:MAG: hypothetical protein FIO02_00850 [Nitrosopumilales archaeon]|nr:hypothetical protein [Nitrosopumilales archaeon]